MEVLKISQNSIKQAVKILKRGRIVVYPTETAYGLGADSTNSKAIKAIYDIKGRAFSKELPLIVDSLKMAERYCLMDDRALKLAAQFWPGPLTLVLKKKKGTHLAVGKTTVALRISSNNTAQLLVEELGRPLTSTSANLSDRPECYSLAELTKQLQNKKAAQQINLALDEGKLPKRPVSTIIDLTGERVKILREGLIKKQDILKVINL